MIEKILSGCQSGADIGGLRTARRFGIPTGGWIPLGFKTQNGPKPEYAVLYGIQEHKSPLYPPRTYQNVKESDGTMRFAAHWDSPGELCTLKAINQYKRPYFDVDLISLDPNSIKLALDWIKEYNIKVLNIAGNSEKTHKGCELKVSFYLAKLFERMGLSESLSV